MSNEETRPRLESNLTSRKSDSITSIQTADRFSYKNRAPHSLLSTKPDVSVGRSRKPRQKIAKCCQRKWESSENAGGVIHHALREDDRLGAQEEKEISAETSRLRHRPACFRICSSNCVDSRNAQLLVVKILQFASICNLMQCTMIPHYLYLRLVRAEQAPRVTRTPTDSVSEKQRG